MVSFKKLSILIGIAIFGVSFVWIFVNWRQNAEGDDESFELERALNINTAEVEEVELLPGIGKVKAKRIIDYRDKIGGFKSIEQLMEVPGIGEGILEKIRGMIILDKYGGFKEKKDKFESHEEKININTASLQELQKLPRIGVVKASRIIEYREKHGGFKSIDEIINVKGIGTKTFEDIKEKITMEDER
jgi:competence protein ComEA